MKLVHLTDLHITPTLSESRLLHAATIINAEKPDVVVVAGDVVSRASEPEMREAYLRAREFRKWLVTPLILSVPGNHDLYDKEFAEHGLYKELWAPVETFAVNLPGAFVVGVNSGRQTDADDVAAIPDVRARRAFEAAAAYIRRGDVDPLAVQTIDKAVQDADLDDIRILALHHHLLPVYNPVYKTSYNFDMVTNAADILEALRRNRFDLVLNGHKHMVQLNTLNGVHHLTGGSLFLDLPQGEENSINVIDVGEQLTIEVVYPATARRRTLHCGPNPKFFGGRNATH